jgi:threonine dehydrogenase-like Zn-dependent dehydrogenase
VLFLSDIFPTRYMAADFCDLKGGETVAIWGCGPVGQFAIRSAFMLGAERVIAIDTVPERLALAEAAGALTLDFRKDDIYDRIQELTAGRGADACIDAVGTEPDTASGFDAVIDRLKVDLHGEGPATCLEAGHSLLPQLWHGLNRRRVWRICRQDSHGISDQPRANISNGPTPVQHYLPKLLERIVKGDIDPSFVTHRASLEDCPALYKTFRAKKTAASRSF